MLEMRQPLEKWTPIQLIVILATLSSLGVLIFHLYSTSLKLKDNTLPLNDIIESSPRLVCYYTVPDPKSNSKVLNLSQVDAHLCTHINIGNVGVENSTIILSDHMKKVLENEVLYIRSQNKNLKLLLWIGGGDSGNGFSEMIVKHDTRKIFIRSLRDILKMYSLDGVDLDWEFPSAYNKERTHFSQLLYEIRQEFKRERRDYILSIAVAAVEGIAVFAYDIREINLYADFVNLMTYDYHFYSRSTPFTGLNAPLYARDVEHSILATLNINYSVNWWLANGIDRHKLVVGLPTYGHSFTLVNPFNNGINAPAENIGTCGDQGFVTYSDVCWFTSHNVAIKYFFDHKTASPFLSSGTEWISFENETSIAIKTNFIHSLDLGGVMAFSLNTDDINGYCLSTKTDSPSAIARFPLIKTIRKMLFKEL